MILTFLLLGLGTTELIVILLVILLLFGAKRIPDLMKSMGKGVKSFKAGMKEVEDEINAPISLPIRTNQSMERIRNLNHTTPGQCLISILYRTEKIINPDHIISL